MDASLGLALDQACEHSRELLEIRIEDSMHIGSEQILSHRELKQWDTFLDAAAGDHEKVASVRLGESTVPFPSARFAAIESAAPLI